LSKSWLGLKKWTSIEHSLTTRLVAFSCAEGIGFSGLFCAIYNLCKGGKFSGLSISNELIAKDEGIHSDLSMHLYLNYTDGLHPREIHKIIKSLVVVEKKFIDKALEFEVSGMDKDSMLQYVQFVADNHCERLGTERIYGVTNPYPSTTQLSLKKKTAFFERRGVSYQKMDLSKVTWEKTDDF